MRPLGRVFWQKKGIYAILRPLGAIFCHERYGKLQGMLIGRFRMVACFRFEEETKSPSRRGFRGDASKEIQESLPRSLPRGGGFKAAPPKMSAAPNNRWETAGRGRHSLLKPCATMESVCISGIRGDAVGTFVSTVSTISNASSNSNTSNMTVDVVIVGAGPAGIFTALSLLKNAPSTAIALV